ncbi:MAG: hypothetical protein DMD87_28860 [Candidatus Rokuibacteriota bacterium]|nr:MAG: hypothetical protein DMD87_28860 [Candidatus Rokubacteria bacterium]
MALLPPLPPLPPLLLPPPLPPPVPPPPLVPPPPPCASTAGAPDEKSMDPDEKSMETKIGKKTSTCVRARARERKARRYQGRVVSPICRPRGARLVTDSGRGPERRQSGESSKSGGETPRGLATDYASKTEPSGRGPSRSGSSPRRGRGEAREDSRHW